MTTAPTTPFSLKADWSLDVFERFFTLGDYAGGEARWCQGCGDHAVLHAVQRILQDAKRPPEQSVAVSGIGCSSRLPHYMGTYGLHGLHGRALPLACGIKARRPDLDLWVATGDGDCFSIGAGHWIHALRLNMDMVVLVFDNTIYGLTKQQTSPTTPSGTATHTHPSGAPLPPLNPLTLSLAVSNISFIAQTVDWSPELLHATIAAAHRHRGTGFVRILQRCPVFAPERSQALIDHPEQFLLLRHPNGIPLEASTAAQFPHHQNHDPSDWGAAMGLARNEAAIPLGLLYHNPAALCYERLSAEGVGMGERDRLAALEAAFDELAL